MGNRFRLERSGAKTDAQRIQANPEYREQIAKDRKAGIMPAEDLRTELMPADLAGITASITAELAIERLALSVEPPVVDADWPAAVPPAPPPATEAPLTPAQIQETPLVEEPQPQGADAAAEAPAGS